MKVKIATVFESDPKIEKKCNEFFDMVAQSALVCLRGVQSYIEKDFTAFEAYEEQIRIYEERADEFRRDAESYLYTETLIPESRGDVLSLLENADNIIDQIRMMMLAFSIEQPEIPTIFHADFINLTAKCVESVDEVILATRMFFTNPSKVKEVLSIVYVLEKESDKQAESLKRKVYRADGISPSNQMHLRYFTTNIDLIADRAEDLADRIGIYVIKRMY
ncbi:MAG: DUF47 domain-containing protein [Candidatus Marinimicrobia bacterium CG08_land_8_20_14_0_20_45_22]|nr:MAG: DUF47 domain-containing protein [Candidatus Marinimicrobia bacterium CG08_land_8_20_14_0_20_45_22]